jgi:hypothetical protein
VYNNFSAVKYQHGGSAQLMRLCTQEAEFMSSVAPPWYETGGGHAYITIQGMVNKFTGFMKAFRRGLQNFCPFSLNKHKMTLKQK